MAACNGIEFSYFAEGSFYLIDLLELSPICYGASFIALGVSTMLGGILSHRLQNSYSSKKVTGYGLKIILLGSGLFSIFILFSTGFLISKAWLIGITVLSQTIIMFGICITISNALRLALIDYKWCIGTASSLFGFFYYCITSLFTFGMGALHNGTLLPMPLYFFTISVFMILIRKIMIRS